MDPRVSEVLVKVEAMHEDIREIKADVKMQNGRVRDLERDMNKAKGLGGVLALAAGWLSWEQVGRWFAPHGGG